MDEQEIADTLYWTIGPCCSGCDNWHRFNAGVGECIRSAPMPGAERAAMLGMEAVSMIVPGGHALTTASHRCGEFSDTFDWSALPLSYRKRVGAPVHA
jgi:hypothetical protein